MSVRFRLFLFAGLACWLLVCVFFYFREYNHTVEFILALAKSEAQSSFTKDMAYRRWASSHGGVYVPIDSLTPPNPYLVNIPEQNLTTPSGRKLTLVNPAYMTRQVHEMAEKQYGAKGHITSLNPIRPANKPDAWEAKMLKAFEKGLKDTAELVNKDGKTYLRYIHSMITEPSCMKCHARQGYKVGQIRGGISVSLPWEKYDAILAARTDELNLFYFILLVVSGAIFSMGYIYINRNLTEKKSAEQLLVKSQERLKSIIAVSKTGVWEYNKNTNYLWCNPEYFSMLGLDSEHLALEGSSNLQTVWIDLLHPDDREEATGHFTAYLNGDGEDMYENYFRMRKKNGEWAWVLSRGQTLRNADGTRSAITLGTFTDVTRRINAEKELEIVNRNLLAAKNYAEENERKLSEYQNLARLGGWELDLSTNIFTFNDNFYKIYHTTAEAMGGYQMSIDTYARQFVHPEDVALVAEETQKAIETDNPDFTGYVEHKINFIDGGTGYIGVKYFIVKDAEGKTIKTYGVNQDITEKKTAELAIMNSKALLDAAFEQTPIPMVLVSMPDSILRTVNQSSLEFLDITDEPSYVGMSIFDFPKSWQDYSASGELLDIKDLPIARAMRGDSVINEEHFIITKHGIKKWELASGTPVFNPKGDIIAAYIIFPDITERKKIEEKLIASDKRYEQIDSSSHDSIYAYDRHGRFTHANLALCNMLGLSREAIIGKTHAELGFPQAQCDEWQLLHDKVYSTGTTVISETSVSIQNGSEMYFEVILNPIYESTGNIAGISGVTRDITDRKLAVEALKESEAQFREIFDHAADAIFIADAESGIIVNANQKAAQLLQCSVHDIIGRHQRELHPQENSQYSEISFKEHRNKIDNSNFSNPVENKVLCSDGTEIPVEVLASKVLYKGKVCLMGIFRDITERKQAQEQLQKSEEMLRMVLDNSRDGINMLDLQTGRYVFMNDAQVKLTGFSPEEINDISAEEVYDRVYPEDRNISVEHQRRIAKGEDIDELVEYRWKVKSGEYRWFSDRRKIVLDEKGKATALVGIIRDITDRKQAEEVLLKAKEKAEEMNLVKSNFFANMSHELRTPMIGILGYSELLMDSKDEEVKRSAEVINRGGKRLMDTLNLILNMSRIEAGKMSTSITVFDGVEVLQEIALAFKQAANLKSLTLETVIEQKPLYMESDQGLLQQILNNLINNAIKYTDIGGVTIRLRQNNKAGENGVEFTVRDTGIGIDPANHEIVFEEFRQVSEGKGRSFEGTGLGLSITKKFVEKLGGTISVEGKLGEGSLFTVWLPNKPGVIPEIAKVKPTEPVKQSKQLIADHEKPFVLYVDDDPVAVSLAKLLMKDICKIETARNSEEAIKKAKTRTYPVILMDINLGKGPDGVETTKIIRKLAEYKDTPIIALTAYAGDTDKEEFIASGCSHFLSKPFNLDDLKLLVQEVLALNPPK